LSIIHRGKLLDAIEKMTTDEANTIHEKIINQKVCLSNPLYQPLRLKWLEKAKALTTADKSN
jgi:hypothetical protein